MIHRALSATTRFVRLPPSDRRLLLWSAALQVAIAVMLRLLPFGWVRSIIDRLTPIVFRARGESAPERIAWAVATVQHFYGRPETCLIQALAAQTILRCPGQPALIRIGVRPPVDGRLTAHAWVESGDRIVVGGRGATAYTALATLHSDGSPDLPVHPDTACMTACTTAILESKCRLLPPR